MGGKCAFQPPAPPQVRLQGPSVHGSRVLILYVIAANIDTPRCKTNLHNNLDFTLRLVPLTHEDNTQSTFRWLYSPVHALQTNKPDQAWNNYPTTSNSSLGFGQAIVSSNAPTCDPCRNRTCNPFSPQRNLVEATEKEVLLCYLGADPHNFDK